MGGVCWYGEIYWNANLSCYLLFRGSCQRPPYFTPLFSSVAQVSGPHSLQETGVGPSHHLSRIQASVAFLPLEMSLGSVGALVEFVGYKVVLRSYFLTGSLILGSLLGNLATIFESGNIAEGVMGSSNAIHANFSSGPFLSLSQPCLRIRQQTNRFCSYYIQASSSTFCKLTVRSNQITAENFTVCVISFWLFFFF